MRKLFLILVMCSSIDAASQTVFKDKRQDLKIELSNESYMANFHDIRLNLGNRALTDMFLEELLVVFGTTSPTFTYVGNTPAKFELVEDYVVVSAKGGSFHLSRNQIQKIKQAIKDK